MNALPLAMIEQRPIHIPTYLNDRLRSFGLWYADNLKELERFYNELAPYCEGEPLEDFFSFAVIQHEREEMKLNTMERLPHGSYSL